MLAEEAIKKAIEDVMSKNKDNKVWDSAHFYTILLIIYYIFSIFNVDIQMK
jgi:hypothetical protein